MFPYGDRLAEPLAGHRRGDHGQHPVAGLDLAVCGIVLGPFIFIGPWMAFRLLDAHPTGEPLIRMGELAKHRRRTIIIDRLAKYG